MGCTNAANSCQRVKGFKESGRDCCVGADEFRAGWEKADQSTRDAMDLALLDGPGAGRRAEDRAHWPARRRVVDRAEQDQAGHRDHQPVGPVDRADQRTATSA